MASEEPSSSRSGVAAVILAAGLGTRMRSRVPKERQPLAGRPLIDYVIDAAASVSPQQMIVVLSRAKAQLADALSGRCQIAWQDEPLGTAHATAQAVPLLEPDVTRVAVLFGDHPLLTGQAIQALLDTAASSDALVTLLTTRLADPAGYGRVVRSQGRVVGVVEARDDATVYREPVEINSGISCYRRDWLERELPNLPRSTSGEYYLTALVERAAREPWPVDPVVAVVAAPEVAHGINDRVELAEAEAVMRRRINEGLMRAGVTIVHPASTFIDATARIEQDVWIEPFTIITGASEVATGCRIGPQSVLRDSRIGPDCEVLASVLEGAEVGARVHIGPFAHLRPGARIGDDVHIGNYAEIKNSIIGARSRMGHFSYVGDAEVGEDVNIGAGAITANYDGVAKHRTVIGDGAFIGVDTVLRAPITVGPRALTGAGSVVTHDVESGQTVVGVPARPMARRDERAKRTEEG